MSTKVGARIALPGGARIALFGGTFDPLHMGHIELIQNVYDELLPDRFIVIPSGCSYMKESMGREITPAPHRLKMLEAGFAGLDLPIEISSVEIGREGPSYSIDTVKYFISEMQSGAILPGDIYFLCGSDVLFGIDKWHRADELLGMIILTVIPRGTDDISEIHRRKAYLEEKFAARIIISNFRGRDISSSYIRDDILGCGELIPAGTYEYIIKNHLYGL